MALSDACQLDDAFAGAALIGSQVSRRSSPNLTIVLPVPQDSVKHFQLRRLFVNARHTVPPLHPSEGGTDAKLARDKL